MALAGSDRGFIATQHFISDLTVVQLGQRGIQAAGHAAVGVGTDVGFHAKTPVIALLRRSHFGITRP